MYTLHAVFNNKSLIDIHYSSMGASIASKHLKAKGWTVKIYDMDGSLLHPLSSNEFNASSALMRAARNV